MDKKEISEDFIKGAEAFKQMMIDASSVIIAPHIEGVFAVFAQQNGFDSIGQEDRNDG